MICGWDESLDAGLEEPPYDSEAERSIGRALDDFKIVFFYKQKIIVHTGGRRELWQPSFTIPWGSVVVDYVAPCNLEAEVDRRSLIYRKNFIPAVVLSDFHLQTPVWKPALYCALNYIHEFMFGLPYSPERS